MVIQGVGLTLGQLVVILIINLICQLVIIISRVGYAGQSITVTGVCNNYGCRAGVSGQHTGSNLQLGDLTNHAIQGINSASL